MSFIARLLVVAFLILAAAHDSSAATIFFAELTTTQEPGAIVPTTTTGEPRPTPFGSAILTLNDAMTELAMTVTIFNIDITGMQTADTNDNLVAAHIHAIAGLIPPASAPVVWGFFGAPDNDNNPDNLIVTPFMSGVGGTFNSIWNEAEGNGGTTLSAQLANIFAGDAYLNFHTNQFRGGEIRGQLQVVPEPTSILLMTGGLLGMLVRSRRRK